MLLLSHGVMSCSFPVLKDRVQLLVLVNAGSLGFHATEMLWLSEFCNLKIRLNWKFKTYAVVYIGVGSFMGSCGVGAVVGWRQLWGGGSCGVGTVVGWGQLWGGGSCGVEAVVGWWQLWGGDSCGVEAVVGWRQLWGGDSCGVGTVVGWGSCGVGTGGRVSPVSSVICMSAQGACVHDCMLKVRRTFLGPYFP